MRKWACRVRNTSSNRAYIIAPPETAGAAAGTTDKDRFTVLDGVASAPQIPDVRAVQ